MIETNSNNYKKKSSVYKPFIFAIVLACGIYLGYLLSLNTIGKARIGEDVKTNKMESILQYIDNKYVDTINTVKLEEQAINDMLSSLDPHSFYIPPVDLKDINDDMRGDFEGVGVEFFIVNDTITIVNAIAGGPSEEAGILAGDKIIAVNDSTIAGVGIKNSHVVKLLKGPKGTNVMVTIFRSQEEIDFSITRAKIPLYSIDISYMLNKNTGLIKINKFSGTTYDEFYNSIIQLKKQGLENLIIDLRQNGGGYLRTAVFIADELLAGKKLVVYTEGSNYKREDYTANRPGEFERGELIVLIDENSASASEILSGALQDWDRALIMGRRSFGKGLVQEQYDMVDNSALRLTVAKYYIPSGRCIQKPYTDKDEYHKDLYDRYENGEYFVVDSTQNDTTIYYTKIKERKVYGGGGIIPDVFIPLDTNVTNLYVNKIRRYIPEYVYSYYSNHTTYFMQFNTIENFDANFKVSDIQFEQFLQFCIEKEWKEDRSKLAKNKANLKLYLKAFFAKQLFQNDGYFKVINKIDPLIKEALIQFENGIELK